MREQEYTSDVPCFQTSPQSVPYPPGIGKANSLISGAEPDRLGGGLQSLTSGFDSHPRLRQRAEPLPRLTQTILFAFLAFPTSGDLMSESSTRQEGSESQDRRERRGIDCGLAVPRFAPLPPKPIRELCDLMH